MKRIILLGILLVILVSMSGCVGIFPPPRYPRIHPVPLPVPVPLRHFPPPTVPMLPPPPILR